MVGGCGINSSGSEYESVASSCERGDESSGCMKGEELFDWLSDC